jgi:NAD(P)-dependent dehydrogenase (short-subunit alcohol dehydrogenase family)
MNTQINMKTNTNDTKKVLVTGASGALGRQVATRFLKAGFAVTGTVLEQPQQADSQLPNIQWIQVDLADPKSVNGAFAGKSYDIIVHCAGGFRFSEVDQLSDADFDFLMKTNLNSAFYLTRELIPSLKKRKFGRIVFMSSLATQEQKPGMAAYSASKAGLNQLTATLAHELKAYNITVNALMPSIIDTPQNRKDMPKANFEQWVPMSHLVETIYFLVSPEGSSINGALIPVAGRV